MLSPLGYHYIPNHRYQRYLDAMAGTAVNLILDPSKDDYMAVRGAMGNRGRIILRSYEWSDGGLDVLHRIARDPIGTGRWMAEKWVQRMKEWGNVVDKDNTYFTGSNEYTVIPGMPIPQFVLAEKTFAEMMAMHGYKACIGNEGVGHPSMQHPNGKVDWSLYKDWEGVIQKTGSILGLHEYWRGEIGPRMNVKPEDEARNMYWYAWRFMQCPFDVPIAITEYGIDQKVDAPMGTPSKGWLGTVDEQTYANQLLEGVTKATEDKRFCGAMIFTSDYASDEWASYDTDRAREQIIQAGRTAPKVVWYNSGSGAKPPVVVPVPPTTQPPVSLNVGLPLPAKSYYITDHFDLDSGEIHQGIDLGALQGTPILAIADGEVAYVGDHRQEDPPPPRGGYGLYIRVWHPQLRMHAFYAHLSEQGVQAGQRVALGQILGKTGNTGNSTGPHLHFEARAADAGGTYLTKTPFPNGRVDPETMLALHGASFKEGAVEKGFLAR